MGNKRIIMWFIAGWLLALFFPPTRLTAMLKGKSA